MTFAKITNGDLLFVNQGDAAEPYQEYTRTPDLGAPAQTLYDDTTPPGTWPSGLGEDPFVSMLGADLILVANDNTNFDVLRMSGATGAFTTFMAPTGKIDDYGYVLYGHMDSAGRLLLVLQSDGVNTHKVIARRFSADLSTHEDTTISTDGADALQGANGVPSHGWPMAASKDGRYLCILKNVGANFTGSVDVITFDLDDSGAQTTVHSFDKDAATNCPEINSGSLPFCGMGIGVHTDGSVLVGYSASTLVSTHVYAYDFYVQQFGGNNKLFHVFNYTDISNLSPAPEAGFNSWLTTDVFGGNHGWASLGMQAISEDHKDSYIYQLDLDSGAITTTEIEPTPGASAELNGRPIQMPILVYDDGARPGLALYPGAGLAATWGPAL